MDAPDPESTVPAWLREQLAAAGMVSARRRRGAFVVPLRERAAKAVAGAVRVPGDKLPFAVAAGRAEVLGADLVHAAVDDLLAAFAFPAMASLSLGGDADGAFAEAVLAGVCRGCRGHDIALADVVFAPTAAPTASLHLHGPVVGEAPAPPAAGDLLVGIVANGLHSTGVGFAAAALAEAGLPLAAPAPDGGTVADALLALHKSYFGVLRDPVLGGWCRAYVHVDAGGLCGSLRAALEGASPAAPAPGLGAVLDPSAWPLPWLLQRLQPKQSLPELGERTGLGLGMVAVCAPDKAAQLHQLLAAWNEPAWTIGRLVAGSGVAFAR